MHVVSDDRYTSPLGSLLRRARVGSELEIEQVAVAICVAPHQIVSLERGAFHLIPEEVYRRNIMRTYSTYLGFSWDAIVDWYEEEAIRARQHFTDEGCPIGSRTAIAAKHFWDMTAIAKHAALILGVTTIVSYLGWLSYVAIRPPELTVTSPERDLASHGDMITVEGVSPQAATILINGTAVTRDHEGHFSQSVALAPGVNIITVAAAKKYSRQTIVSRQVVWEDHTAATPPVQFIGPILSTTTPAK